MGQANFASGTPTKYFYNRDHLGSIRELTDSAGAIKTRYGFDPYGVVTETFVSGSVSADMQYAGYYAHARSGLSMPVYRAYSAPMGRFVNRDPILEFAGLNLFGYVQNNPLCWFDRLGLEPVSPYTSPEFIQSRLAFHLDEAIDSANSLLNLFGVQGTGFMLGLGVNPTMPHALAGDILDKIWKEKIMKDKCLSKVVKITPTRGGRGPDVYSEALGRWWDLMPDSRGQFEHHNDKYEKDYGKGYGFLYQFINNPLHY